MRLDTHLRLPLNHPDGEKIAERLTRSNPEYTQALRLGFSTHGKPRVIREYTTTDTHWIFPRYWAKAVSNREQIEDRTVLGEPADLGTAIIPRDYQVKPIDEAVTLLKEDNGTTLQALPGAGKCLAKDTPVIMASGEVKPVQDVQVGDRVMGPDGKGRNVLSLGRGRSMMYRVTPVKGESYVVNEDHILSFKKSGNTTLRLADGRVIPADGDVVNVDVKTYLESSAMVKHYLKGWRSERIESFEVQGDDGITVPPYIVGAYLGDGSLRKNTGSFMPAVSKPPCKMVDEWVSYVGDMGMDVKVSDTSGGKCPTWTATTGTNSGGKVKNTVAIALVELGLDVRREIPVPYKTGSSYVRRELLAGIIDSDGHVDARKHHVDFISKYKEFAEDVAFVARSLGLSAYVTESVKGIKEIGFRGTYYRVSISGDFSDIPTRDKLFNGSRRQKKRHLVHGIKSVEPIGEDDYYGFTIDGDHLFLLGDFTVTHNTVASLAVAQRLGRKTLVLVHTEFLLDQWADRVKEFMGIEAGRVQQDVYDVDKPIVIAMMQTLNAREYPPEFFSMFGLVVSDECVSHDAHVLTDRGSIRAERLYQMWVEGNAPKIATRDDNGIKYVQIGHGWERDKDSSVEIKVHRGDSIVVSHEHEMHVLRTEPKMELMWVKAEDVKPGDLLVRPTEYETSESKTRIDVDRDAYFIGLFTGDGSWPGQMRNRVRFSFTKDVDWYVDTLTELCDDVRVTKNTRGDTLVSIGGRRVDELREYGFTPGAKAGSMGWINFEDRGFNWAVSFLRGLFDADGNATRDRIQLGLTDKELIYRIHRFLYRHGVANGVSVRPRRNSRHGNLYNLTIFGKSVSRFMEIVGFGHTRKHREASNIVSTSRDSSNNDNIPVRELYRRYGPRGVSISKLAELAGLPSHLVDKSSIPRVRIKAIRDSVGDLLDNWGDRVYNSTTAIDVGVRIRDVAKIVGLTPSYVGVIKDKLTDEFLNLAEEVRDAYRDLYKELEWVELGFETLPVIKVSEAGGGKFYDFEVPGTHRFIANGLEVHNCHRASAPTLSTAIQQFPARYRLGLTATPRRKDGLEWIYFSHIGPVGVVMSREELKPTVYRVNTNTESRDPNALRHRGKPSFTKAVSFIVEDEGRTALIAALAVDAVENGRGKIIVFSQRRKHLEVLQEYYVAQCEARGLNDASEDWAFYVGGMTTEQREEAEKHRVLFATVSLAAEGLDIPELDTVILSTPVADTIQIVGRAQRTMEGKLKPIVIDIVDRYVPELMGSARKRLRQYQEQGWEVRDVRD